MIFGKYINIYYLKYFLFFLFGLLALLAVNWVQLEIPRICGSILDGIGDAAKNDPESLFIILRESINLCLSLESSL